MNFFQRWARRRAMRLEQEEERLERIEARRQAFRNRDDSSTVASVASALGAALDRTFQIESKLLEQMGGFLSVLEDASAKRAAQVLGARGGRRTGERRKALPKPPACPLCANPSRRDVTWEMVASHKAHDQLNHDGVKADDGSDH